MNKTWLLPRCIKLEVRSLLERDVSTSSASSPVTSPRLIQYWRGLFLVFCLGYYTLRNSNIFIIISKKDWQCKAGRGRLTPYQSEDPSPTLPTYRGKEEKGKIVEDKKGEHWTCSWNPPIPHHQIRVNQIIPERYWEGNKSPAELRGSAARRRKSIPMCDQSTACNPDWHIRHR